MHIGELADRSGISHRTLRHYEEIGLLPPSGRTDGGFRIYTETDFRRLMTIRRMKALNYSTTDMGALLALLDVAEDASADPEDRAEARRALEEMLDDARARREKLAEQVRRADEFLGILEGRLDSA